MFVQIGERRGDAFAQPFARVALSDGSFAHALHEQVRAVLQKPVDHGFLRPEIVVHGAFGDPGALGDLFNAHVGASPMLHDLHRGGKEFALGFAGAARSACGVRRIGHGDGSLRDGCCSLHTKALHRDFGD